MIILRDKRKWIKNFSNAICIKERKGHTMSSTIAIVIFSHDFSEFELELVPKIPRYDSPGNLQNFYLNPFVSLPLNTTENFKIRNMYYCKAMHYGLWGKFPEIPRKFLDFTRVFV